jgi:chemotaxis protein MotB
MDKLARTVSSVRTQVLLEGHTDSVPISTPRFASNWELSAARSISILNMLTTKYHIPDGHLAVAGYAATSPMAPNDTPDGRARNRRVDVVFLSKLALSAAPQTMGNPPAAKPKSGH